MFSKELEELIESVLVDGVITDKEREVLHKRALAEGVDTDELDVVVDSRLAKMLKASNPTPTAAPKSQKIGNVLKCPNCGAQVVGGSAVCPICGYAFMNVEANSSYERLSKKLEDIDVAYRDRLSFTIPLCGVSARVKEKASAIRVFPVPNTRADLLEFLAYLSAQLESMKTNTQLQVFEEELMRKTYQAKYKECRNKARISFSNDPDFRPYLEKKRGFLGLIEGYEKVIIGLIILIVWFIGAILLLSYVEGK